MANGNGETEGTDTNLNPETQEPITGRKGKKDTKSIKEQLADFKAKGGQVEELAPATEADALKATVNPMLQENSAEATAEPARDIPATDVVALYSKMSDIDCYTVTLTFQQICDYVCFASDLYDTKTMPIVDQWQRKLDKRRVKGTTKKSTGEHKAGIVDYLTKSVHFFPPILAVPSSDSGLQVAFDASAETQRHMVHLADSSLAALDGQHRIAAIALALESYPDLANESMVVQILNLPSNDVERRQQVFADVNGNAQRVSKATNAVYDHSDPVNQLAKQIVMCFRVSSAPDKDGNQVQYENHPLRDRVEMEKLTPANKSNQFLSLMNLINLIEPLHGAKDTSGERILSDSQIEDTVLAIVDNLPQSAGVKEGRVNYKACRDMFIWPYSTSWKALGRCLASVATKRNEDDSFKVPAETFALWTGSFVHKLGMDGWSLDDERWQQSGRMVVVDKKVGSRMEYISHMASVLSDYVNV